MKKLAILIFLYSFFTEVYAFRCEYVSDGQLIPASGTGIVDVPLDSDLVIDSTLGQVNEYADVDNYIRCFNQQPESFRDFLEMRSFQPGINPEANFGIQIQGVNYFTQPATPVNVLNLETGTIIPLPMKLIMKVDNRPGAGIFIRKGDTLITLQMHKYAWQYSTGNNNHQPENFTWVFKAANDIFLTLGTCNINHGQVIVIDLGTIHRSRITGPGSGASSDGATNFEVSYQCENNDGSIDENFDAKIKLYLSATPSSFSDTAVQTRRGWMPGAGRVIDSLGIEFSHVNSGQILKPNDQVSGYFTSEINSGIGQDTLRVGPVKDVDPLSPVLEDGEFNAVATLIMTSE